MEPLTLEQQQALALARARLRLRQQKPPADAPPIAGGVDPTEGMSGLSKFAAGMGKAISDVGLGTRQLAAYAGLGDREALSEEARARRERDRPLMGTGAGIAGNIAGHVGMSLLPGGAVKTAGAFLKAPAVSAAGSALLAPQTIKGAAALGGAYGALQPTENLAERAGNVALGGVAGAAVPAAIRTFQVGKALIDPMHEAGQRQVIGRLLRGAAGENADEAMRAMQGARELVPGSLPTAGQASGSPGIAALERAAAQANPEEYATRWANQNAARVGLLEGLTGSAGQRASADAARQAAAKQLYERAYARGVDVSRFPEKTSPFVTPSGASDLTAAAQQAKVAEPQSLLGAIKKLGGIKSAEGTMRDITGEAKVAKGIPVGLFHKKGVGLDDLATQLRERGYAIPDDVDGGVQALRDMIRDEVSGAGKHYSMLDEAAVLQRLSAQRQADEAAQAGWNSATMGVGGVRGPQPRTRANDKLLALLERPAVKDAVKQAKTLAANEGVALDSVEGSVRGLDYVKRALDDKIAGAQGNEQRILTALKNDLVAAIDDLSPSYAKARQTFAAQSRPINQMDIAQTIADKSVNKLTGTLQPQAFARALSDDTAVRATGFGKATLEGTMTPQQLQQLNAIKEDLARSVFQQNAGRGPGSNTFQNLAQENLLNQAGVQSLPQLLSRPVQLTNYALRSVYGAANRDMKNRLAEALLNPQDTAAMMQAASESERAFLAQMLRNLTPLGVATPGLVNANQ